MRGTATDSGKSSGAAGGGGRFGDLPRTPGGSEVGSATCLKSSVEKPAGQLKAA